MLLVALAAFCTLVLAGWTLQSGEVGQAIKLAGALVLGVFAVALIWRRPDLVVYGLFFAAVTIEKSPLGSGLSFTDMVPAFRNIQTLLPLPGLIISPVEAMALLTLVVLFVKSRVEPQAMVSFGPLWLPFAVLLGVICLGLFRGVQAGGDLRIALWSVRALFLMFTAYVLTVSVVRRPEQLRVLFLLLLAGISLKGLIGVWRFVVDFKGHTSAEVITGLPGNSLMAHEESFFFLIAVFMAVMAVSYGFPKHDRQFAIMAFAVSFVPLLANQRRVAIAAFLVAALVYLVVTYALEPKRRRAIVSLVMVIALVAPVYGIATWNSDSLIAMPAQAIKSQFAPGQRDASSDQYRRIENTNLRATARDNPLLGVGFGVPMTQEQILPNISSTFEWYLFMPHNGFLWLGMTTGVAGMTALAWLFSHAILKTLAAVRTVGDDPRLRALYMLGLVTTAVFLTFAVYDQGLLNQRLGLFMGVQFGLLAMLPTLAGAIAATPPTHVSVLNASPASPESERGKVGEVPNTYSTSSPSPPAGRGLGGGVTP